MTALDLPPHGMHTGAAARPRVLLIGSRFSGGGAETRLRMLSTHLFGGDVDTALLMGLDADSTASHFGRVYELGWRGRASYPGAVVRLRRVIGSGRYGAVLALGLHQNAILWAATRGMSRRPAIIMTETTQPYTNDLLARQPVVRKVRELTRRTVYRRADCVAANSIDGVKEIVQHYGVDEDLVIRIPNMIDRKHVARLSEEPLPPLPQPHVQSVCMVTRLEEMKRVDTLIEAMHGLTSRPGMCVEVIGDGPWLGPLQELAEQRGIADRVYFRGWQKNPQPYMARASATVLCSAYEGFSNTLLESMAIGTPVVTSFCSADARAMVDAGAALGFEIGDSNTLREQLSRLLSDGRIRQALIQHASDYIAPHILENAVVSYEALIDRAIGARLATGRGKRSE